MNTTINFQQPLQKRRSGGKFSRAARQSVGPAPVSRARLSRLPRKTFFLFFQYEKKTKAQGREHLCRKDGDTKAKLMFALLNYATGGNQFHPVACDGSVTMNIVDVSSSGKWACNAPDAGAQNFGTT